ncbi:MAG: hypothetical protein A2663_04305 [Candidatus Buchananbacteria bacterium RIFCSPHIGHO2_01_FULL_46_12]|uniref:Uncharacterized protein n=1 Tax=Candidatus Buchananbacteria bacterium RIFCSPHIGHO2_01_FULL_46_12 TaxID=1797536 RepID=A0A1G1Y512_9BACT|nr:MAG: hypothetical protein A2663_04305 [Candidatus Buchananbacteria bacterium RIFCSPHIGHO2_01_FULL_46_12]
MGDDAKVSYISHKKINAGLYYKVLNTKNRKKLQIPNYKFQTNHKHQITNSKREIKDLEF